MLTQRIIIIVYLFFSGIPWSLADNLYTFKDPSQEMRFNHLLKEFRCLVCQNQDLADSNAVLAYDLKRQIYLLLVHGNTDANIIEYLVTRYGDYILFNPPIKITTIILWFGPAVFFLIGIIIFFRCIKNE